MRMHGYSRQAEHVEPHKHFLDKLDQLQIFTLSRQVTMNTINYLRNWYTDHMKTQDRDFVRYIIDHGKVNLTRLPAAQPCRTTYNAPTGGVGGMSKHKEGQGIATPTPQLN